MLGGQTPENTISAASNNCSLRSLFLFFLDAGVYRLFTSAIPTIYVVRASGLRFDFQKELRVYAQIKILLGLN